MPSFGSGLGFGFGGDAAFDAASAAAVPRLRDLLFDELTHDVSLTAGGDIAFVVDLEGVAQACRQAMRLQLGEWFLDEQAGLPWFRGADGARGILDKNPDLGAVRELVRDALLTVAGVLSVTSIDVSLDKSARALTVTFTVASDLGELVSALEVN